MPKSEPIRKLLKMDDFFRLDYRTGAVVNELTEERAQVVPAFHFKKLKDNLTREFQEKAPLIISVMGSTLGSSFAEEMSKNISDPETLVKNLFDMLAASGWGVLSMVGDTRYGSSCVVTAANCAFCEKEELTDSPSCDFLVGAVKGMSDRVYGVPHQVWEEKCTTIGDSVCQFIVQECETKFCDDCNNSKFCECAAKNKRSSQDQNSVTFSPKQIP